MLNHHVSAASSQVPCKEFTVPQFQRDNQSTTIPQACSHEDANEARIAALELVRKCRLKYDGSRDPLTFPERVEELAKLYQPELNRIVSISKLIKDNAMVLVRSSARSNQPETIL